MTLREHVDELRARSRWIAGGLLVGLAVGWLTAALTPAQYASSTTLYVTQGLHTYDPIAAYQGGLLSTQRMKSYTGLARSVRVANEVVSQLGLHESAEAVAGRITTVSQPDTVLLTVTATDSSPQAAARLANATAESFQRLVGQLELPVGAEGPPTVRVEVVEAARTPTTPVAPNLPLHLVLGGVIGLLLGMGAAALRRSLGDAITSASGVQDATGVPVLGVIPSRTGSRRGRPAETTPAEDEAYRRVRANLHHSGNLLGHRVLAVTSSVHGEGRSTLVRKLAVAMAAGGSRVLAVDADLRHGEMSKSLGMDEQPGLTDVLAGWISTDQAIQPCADRSFDVLGGGSAALNPSELVGSHHFAMLLGELRGRYDVVLLDSPPLLDVADAAELAAIADGAVIACRFGRTRHKQLAAGIEALSAVSTRIVGVIIVMAPSRGRRMPFTVPFSRGAGADGSGHGAQSLLAGTLRPARPRHAAEFHGAPQQHVIPVPADPVGTSSPDTEGIASSGPNHHGPVNHE